MEESELTKALNKLRNQIPSEKSIKDIKKEIATHIIDENIESSSSKRCSNLLNFYLNPTLEPDEWEAFLIENKKEICMMAKGEAVNRIAKFAGEEGGNKGQEQSSDQKRNPEHAHDSQKWSTSTASAATLSKKEKRIKIADLDLSDFTVTLLAIAGIKTVGDLMEFEREEPDGVGGIEWMDSRKIEQLNTAFAN